MDSFRFFSSFFPGGGCEQASGKRGRCCCFWCCCTPGRFWRLVTRGASLLDALLVCMVPLRLFGGAGVKKRRVDVAGGNASDCAVLLGVPRASSFVVHDI